MGLISKSAEYAVRATLYMAAREDGRFIPVGEMSRRMRISFHFLTKILQKLTRRGLLRSARGPRGGVALARPAGRISVREIVETLDGRKPFGSCLLGLKGCGRRPPCPLHRYWAAESGRIAARLEKVTIGLLARQRARHNLRLSN